MIPAPAFTSRANDRVGTAIANASARTGVDFDYLLGQARLESGFNPDARARTSSATGLYQFIDSTWLGVVAQHGAAHGLGWAAAAIERGGDGRYRVADPATRRAIMDLRRQPEAASAMAAEFAADNARHLETRLGRAAEPVDLYLAHFLGAGGASRFLARHDAEPGAAAAPEFARQARANPSIFYGRGGVPRSFGQIRSLFERRLGVEGGTTMMAAPRRAPDNIGTYAEMQAALRTHSAATPPLTQTVTQSVTPDGGRDAAIVQARLAYLMLAQLGGVTMAALALSNWRRALPGAQMLLPAATLALVLLLVVPVPALLLDVGFILNIMLSLAVLMVALNVARPLDFSAFPTVLLFATLLRLGLNVASTRVVLVSGHEGPGAAGHVIEAFGTFMIGGDYAVGIFVFVILMIINLIVITKGAGRVSEVSARFVLDAMPGKQMAIDADLNAGLLTPDEAKLRRQEVATEADFYGSMDGASKFVKGDAVAGVLILLVNIVGGLVLGVVSHGLSVGEAASTYMLLAIGDALVAAVPALLLSIAAASIVTRVTSPLDLSGQLVAQFSHSRAWVPVTAILTALGLIPGMPHLLVLSAAAGAGTIAWRLHKRERLAALPAAAEPAPAPHIIEWADVGEEAAISLDLGFALVGLVDERRGAPLMARITGIRRQISREFGFVVPFVKVSDDLTLAPQRYRITIAGVAYGEGEVWADELLALDAGEVIDPIDGRATKDPTYGLDALWIERARQAEATVSGYTVVDAATVIATHLNRLIREQAGELFGIDEAQAFIDALRVSAPQLVSNLCPQPLSLPVVAALCRELLGEGISLREGRRVASAMVDAARAEPAPAMLAEAVRSRLAPLIVQSLAGFDEPLRVVTLDAGLEAMLAQAVRTSGGDAYPIDPVLAQRIVQSVGEACGNGAALALVTAPLNRKPLARILSVPLPTLRVLAFTEIPERKAIEVVAIVGDAGASPLPFRGEAGSGAVDDEPVPSGPPLPNPSREREGL